MTDPRLTAASAWLAMHSTTSGTHAIIDALPDGVDPCGENGEFHTFVLDGPMMRHAIDVTRGEVVERDGFVFADLLPTASAAGADT